MSKRRTKLKKLSRVVRRHIAKFRKIGRHGLANVTFIHIATAVVLVCVVFQMLAIGLNTLNKNKPILGVRLEGYMVGRLDRDDFQKQADAIIHQREYKPLTVYVADQTSTITLRKLGVDINEKDVHKRLLQAGRTGNILTRFMNQGLALFGGHNLSLENSNFNTELAKAYIATLDQKIDIPPANAYFAYEQQQIVVHPDTPGRVIDSAAATEILRRAKPEQHNQIFLPIKPTTAEVTALLLNPLLPEVQAIAQKSLMVIVGSSQVTLSPEQLMGLVVPKLAPDPHNASKMTASVAFDEAKLNAIVDEVIKRAVVAPQPTIMRGGRVIQQGSSGLRIEDSHSLARVFTALVQRQTGAAAPDEVHIPLVSVPPPIIQQVVSSPRTRTGSGLVRLTFDDGPGAYTEQILDILRRYNVRATFYVIGRNAQQYPGTLRRIKNDGHSIGNHSFTHANLTNLSRAGVVQELTSTQSAVQQAAGITPTGFRPPYGAHNQTVRDVAASLGMSLDMWSVDARDWAQPGSSVITRRVLEGTGSGAVILLHVLYQQTVTALPSIIEGIRAQGYTLE